MNIQSRLFYWMVTNSSKIDKILSLALIFVIELAQLIPISKTNYVGTSTNIVAHRYRNCPAS